MLPHPCVQALAGCARFDWDSRSLACTFYSLSSPREGMVSGQAYCQVSPALATCPACGMHLQGKTSRNKALEKLALKLIC